MAARMTIGDFSRANGLSAKTLRFYHQVGLLKPASIDPSNGYRLYDADQIVDAQVSVNCVPSRFPSRRSARSCSPPTSRPVMS